MKVMSVFGTRPEAIKMCPLILELKKHREIENIVCLSGQHREMLDQVMDIFDIHAEHDLQIMRPGQTLAQVTGDVLKGLTQTLQQEKPDLVLVHGDTTTSFTSALASFYQKVPVGHVEAGLRTYNPYSPFPEEMNRCLISRIAQLHFTPTENNKENLWKENIREHVYVTGNTVIDAFQRTVKPNYCFKNQDLQKLQAKSRQSVLITAHRRENIGRPLENITHAVRRLAYKYPHLDFIYPVHLNPSVQDTVRRVLSGISNVYLIPPIDVEDMHNLLARSYLVMTDSGGLQEEAPAFGVPVLVLRTETERPEAAWAGTVKVAGIEEETVFAQVVKLVEDQAEYEKMAKAVNPYGDGHASERIVSHILEWGRKCEK